MVWRSDRAADSVRKYGLLGAVADVKILRARLA